MRPAIARNGAALALPLAALLAGPAAPRAADDAFSPAADVIGSHQIDRFEAIGRLQQELRRGPERLADWVILGELAQEVALDVPSSQAGAYLAIARDAYANALRLSPEDPGLRAAFAFVKDQEAHLDAFNRDRARLTDGYLDARRREVGRHGATPMLRVYAAPPPITARAASRVEPAGPPGALIDPGPAAVPFYVPAYRPVYEGQEPVTYDEYYRSNFANGPRAGLPSPQRPTGRGFPTPPEARPIAPGPTGLGSGVPAPDPAAVGTMPSTAPPAGTPPAVPPPTAPRPR